MNAWLKSAVNKVQEPDWKDDIRPCLSIALPNCFVYGRALFAEKLRYDTEILKKLNYFFYADMIQPANYLQLTSTIKT